MNTVVWTPEGEDNFFTAAFLNAYFASVATVLNGKLDVRGDTLGGDLLLSSGSIINVPPAVEVGDIIPVISVTGL